MSDEGFEIPIGGDLSQLNDAIDKIVAAFTAVSASINESFAKANASIEASTARMRASNAAAMQSAASHAQTGVAVQGMTSKMLTLVGVAGNVGNAFSGAKAAVDLMSRSSRTLAGVNLAQNLTSIVSRAGGVRAAFAKIPAAMSAIASNPTLRKIVIGAAAAAAAIITIRAAWRTAASTVRLLGDGARATFSALVSGAQRAGSAIKGALSMPGKLAGGIPGLPIAGILGGIGGVAGAITLAMKSIGAAAEMETLETAFAPLIGGSENAKKRIAELSAFAAATPFELPEVAQASRVLEVLTKGALSTGKGLTMVGDVAAATQQPFQEIAMWVGRLYDGLQSGRPVGEAMMRLQEMGVVSGNVRGRIEALQKSGADGNAIWNEATIALSRFGGSMDRQSETWSGKMSTLNDNIKTVYAAFGKPIIDGLKPYLDMVSARILSMKDEAVTLGLKVKTALNAALAAFQTGNTFDFVALNIQLAMVSGINTFVAGMKAGMAALGPVFAALWKYLESTRIIGVLESGAKMFGSLLKAAMYSAVGALDSGLREAAIGFANIVNPLFGKRLMSAVLGEDGRSKFQTAADAELDGASMFKKLAIDNFKNIDFSSGSGAMKEAFVASIKKFQDEYQAALSDPAISPGQWKDKLAKINQDIKARMDKNQADADRRAKELDEKNKNAPSKESPLATIAKAITPAVTSLGRVGGGGAGRAFSPMISEQRKGNGILATIAKNTSRTPAGVPVIA